uniref:CEP170 C-terminal domain-containing protein n=1 Tax=Cuerna arida TaxID=1464854 RepID=A0A1B6G551_9HEMI
MESDTESFDTAQLAEEVANLPQAYAFTVHFDNGKQNSGEMANKFSRRHVRNLSLPISKVYENKVNVEGSVNGRVTKRAGNHSEGYFSSDPDDDSKPKLFEAKQKNVDIKGLKTTNAVQEKHSHSVTAATATSVREVEGAEDDTSSDVASEAGTYTIDKDSPEVTNARQSIDTVFGVQAKAEDTKKTQTNSTHTSSTWINEWATSVVEHNNHTGADTGTLVRNTGVSLASTKIPSPVNTRSRLPPMTQPLRADYPEPRRPSLSRKSYPVSAQEVSKIETESYLRATERVVSALAARVSLSLDSGGESDAENSLGHVVEPTAGGDRDSSASDSSNTRYNKAFSLRRGRLEDSKKKITSSVVLSKLKSEPIKAIPPRVTKRESLPASSPSFSRTDCGRFSMRTPRPLPQSPLLSNAKKEVGVIKKKTGSGGSARSNSTLSSKEVEFQNWKRRKSYDPMKAAAEGKKKEAAKKQPPLAMTQSTNSTITTPKSPVNPVLRSASFHGTRQLTASSSDEEEEEEITLSAEDEDWPVLQAPRTSLENTPQGSRVSLYSNTSNSPTPPLRNRPKLEGVDSLVISALAGLSSKLKGSSCNLLNKLRYLYDEDSPKNHQLAAMIDQLEASEPGSPQVKSPSRELATTLRNLKRLESMLKVLDDVLFDEEEFQ